MSNVCFELLGFRFCNFPIKGELFILSQFLQSSYSLFLLQHYSVPEYKIQNIKILKVIRLC